VNQRLIYVSMLLYCCFSLVLPVLFVNKIVFFLMFMVLACVIFKAKLQTFSPFIIFSIFLYSFVLSFGFDYSSGLRIQLMLVTFTLFLIYLIETFAIDMNKVVISSSVVFSISTLLLVYSVVNETSVIFLLFEKYGEIAVGSRDVGSGSQEFFRLGSAPFLYVGFSILLKRMTSNVKLMDCIYLVLIVTCILLSSTRSILIGCILISFFILFRKYLTLVLPLVLFSVVCIMMNTDFSGTMFDSNDFGNSIKLKDVGSFVDWARPVNLLFGEGLASLYYSDGRGYLVSQTEITLLDNVRYFGVPLTLIFYFAVLWPILNRVPWRVDNGFPFAVMSIYILMALTNPMLINSFGFIVVLWYWANILKVTKK